ncbi:MAG: biotin/lipoate A/B protein ligase family protein [bacterium]|nr:biotin/lipoate A/B protein ligase family protein [bacterium]
MPLINEIGLLPFEVASGARQMAIDQWMLEQPGAWLRFYGWLRPTLSLGRNQGPDPQMNLSAARAAGIDLVRRATGGQAVLHHLELTYSFAAGVPPMARSILQSYRDIRQPLLTGLSTLGLSLSAAPEEAKFRPVSSVCFAKAAGHEILYQGRKLVGSAQRRSRGRLLQHGSILLGLDLDLHQRVWPQRAAQDWARETANLGEILGEVEPEGLAKRLEISFALAFGAQLRPHQWSAEERQGLKATEGRFSVL